MSFIWYRVQKSRFWAFIRTGVGKKLSNLISGGFLLEGNNNVQ